MGIVVLPNTLTAHTDAIAAEVMANYNAILAQINGSLNEENLAASIVNALFSPGDIKPSARAAAPEGWLICDGSAVSRTTYAALFAAIGTAYGAGNGVTTFNIPDLRGRTIFGVDGGPGRITENVFRGQSGGHKNMPFHAHGVGSLDDTFGGNHTHAHGAWTTMGLAGGGIFVEALLGGGSAHTAAAGTHDHTLFGSTGGQGTGPSGGDDRIPPYTICYWMVKT